MKPLTKQELQALAHACGYVNLRGDYEILRRDAGGRVMAMDAQPTLITSANSGIPNWLTNYVDPQLIQTLIAPMRAAEILGGEVKKGSWTDDTAIFSMVENVGSTASYGDYSNNGNANANINWPSRQVYRYQTVIEWGDLEAERAGLAKVPWVAQKKIASALALNKFQNRAYFFGIANLANYGLLNDPNLIAPIAPTSAWASATGDVIFEDIRRLYAQLVAQANGVIDSKMSFVLAMSPASEATLMKTNQYGISVEDLIKKNLPGAKIVTAPEYATSGGNLVQMILTDYEGQKTAVPAFNEKLREYQIIPDLSSWKQKQAQGVWGTIIFRPVFIAQLLGV